MSGKAKTIKEFYHNHKNIILKPLYENGGSGVCKIESNQHFNEILPQYLKKYHYIIAQQFLPEIKDGDKRVLLIDGEILGAIRRIPAPNSYLANLSAGASAAATTLTKREKEIALTVAKTLKRDGIFFAGIDLIDQQLIEINVTSPTGCKAYNEVYRTNCEEIIADKIYARLR